MNITNKEQKSNNNCSLYLNDRYTSTSNYYFKLLLLTLIIGNTHLITRCHAQDDVWSLQQLIPDNYNKHEVPKSENENERESVTLVKVGIEVTELVSVSESSQSITLDFILHMKWHDHRLNLPPEMSNSTHIVLDHNWLSKLWVPDIYFRNAIEAKVLQILNPIVYAVISNDHSVIQSIRMNVKLQCKMDLSHYPQDVQYCPIDIVSLTRNEASLLLSWSHFSTPPSNDNPKFLIRTTNIENCTKFDYLGKFSCLRAKMKLVRRVSYYVIRVYAPTFLTTISSFFTFWIPTSAWPARVVLVVTPLLTLVTQNININTEINVSYIVAIHWWMFWCILFVFLGLVEFVIAISWSYRANALKALKSTGARDDNNNMPKPITFHRSNNWFHKSGRVIGDVLEKCFGNIDYTKEPLSRNKVDYSSRVLFPVLYILFVFIYVIVFVCMGE